MRGMRVMRGQSRYLSLKDTDFSGINTMITVQKLEGRGVEATWAAGVWQSLLHHLESEGNGDSKEWDFFCYHLKSQLKDG